VYRGSRTQQTGGSAQDLTTTASQPFVTPTNSLARSAAGNDLYIYLTGASSGGTWDGFWWGDTTTPSGLTYTVPSTYVNQVRDRANGTGSFAANNPVEDVNVNWVAAPVAATSDPKGGFTTKADGTVIIPETNTNTRAGWEADDPDFAPYTVVGSTYEVVPLDPSNTGTVTEVQIHIISNQNNNQQGWTPTSTLSTSAHPDQTPIDYGVRDTSLTSFHSGFSMDLAPGTSFQTASAGFDTGVQNTLFDGSTAPTGFSTADDGYFKIFFVGAPASWKPAASYQFKYDAFLGMGTNLTGRLIKSTPTTGLLAVDRTPPTISLTLASNGGKYVYVQFSRQVIANSPSSDPQLKDVLALSPPALGYTITLMSPIDMTSTGAANSSTNSFQQAKLTLSKPLQPQDYATLQIKAVSYASGNGNTTITAANNDMDTSVAYPISNLGIDLIQPIWASDGSGGEANTAGTDRVIHDFTGLEALTARDITMQVNVAGGTTFTSLPLRLFYDLNVSHTAGKVTTDGLWLPTGIFQPTNQASTANPKAAFAVVPSVGDGAVRSLAPTASNAAGNLKTFVVPGSDSGIKTGSELQFVFRVGAFYAVRGLSPTDPTQISVYRIPLKGIKEQKNGVTILHNVIDPTQGQKTEILYTMKKAGVVTAQVFALDGSLVRILQRGRQAAGDYSLFWDGKNEGGKIVARGVYFVRVVAPDTDETRNILVIK
jgi:hypothetical protein